jgi:SAM-dependent methyltransferase
MNLTYHPFESSYTNDTLRGTDITPRPDLVQTIAQTYGNTDKLLLDIGCGAGHKLQQMAPYFGTAIGLEPSVDMVKQAQNIQRDSDNIQIIRGIGQMLPLKDQTIDVMTAILTWWDPQEIHRALKPQGVLLIECIGPEDKTEFTKYFGKDEKGWRGANLNTNLLEMTEIIKHKLSPFFTDIDIQNKCWQTAYSSQGLWQLLNNTHTTVRNFDPQTDDKNFDKAIQLLSQNEQIILTQNRLIIIGNKIAK